MKYSNADLRSMVKAKVEETYLVAEAHYDKIFARPKIVFKLTGRVAGYASWKHKHLDFNLQLLKHNVEDFLARTVPHEVAHLIAHAVYGKAMVRKTRRGGLRYQAHGPKWKAVMRILGVDDITRCHHYDTSVSSKRKTKQFEYACGCQTFKLGIVRHNRFRTGNVSYHCLKCKDDLVFIKQLH